MIDEPVLFISYQIMADLMFEPLRHVRRPEGWPEPLSTLVYGATLAGIAERGIRKVVEMREQGII